MNRRRYLGLIGGGAITSLAGCSRLFEGLLDFALEDLNVVTDSDEPVTIHVEIDDVHGETVFEESVSFEGVEEDDEESTEQYEEVWEEPGKYRVRADVEEGPIEIATVEVSETDDSLLVVYEEGELEIGLFEELADDE